MSLQYRYTKHQVARGTKADAERHDAYFLFKNVSSLRLTYQIRLLTYRALETKRKLIIRIPANCRIHTTLRDFQKEHSRYVRIERVDE
jgi:hypothetical protein